MKGRGISLRAYADHRRANKLAGGTLKAVQVAIESGRLNTSLTPQGKIKSAAVADVEWAATTHEDRIPISDGTGGERRAPSRLQENRARREAALAELAEIELGEKKATLILAADVEARLVNVFSQCRTKLLGVPARMRQLDPSLTDTQIDVIADAIHEALVDLGGGERQS